MSAFFIRRIISIDCPVVSSMVSKGMVDKQKVTSITIPVSGMTCAACVYHVGEALEGVPQVEQAVVNLATEKATVHIRNGEIQKDLLKSESKMPDTKWALNLYPYPLKE